MLTSRCRFFALLRDDHVRVDIFYRPAKLRTRAITDLIGVVFIPAALYPGIVLQSYSMPIRAGAPGAYHEGSAPTSVDAGAL